MLKKSNECELTDITNYIYYIYENPDVYTFELSPVSYDIDKITPDFVISNNASIVIYSDIEYTQALESPYKLNVGDNTFYAVVTAENGIDSNSYIISVIRNENTITQQPLSVEDWELLSTNSILISVFNNSEANITGTVLAGIYENNRLIEIKCVDKTIISGENSEIEIIFDTQLNNGYFIKAFVWEEMGKIIPVSDVLKKQVPHIIYEVLESEHLYKSDTDEIKEYIYDGECQSIDLTFSEDTFTQINRDYIYILDKDNNEIGKYSGGQLAGVTIKVPGNVVKIRLTSNGSIEKYGYRTEMLVVNE